MEHAWDGISSSFVASTPNGRGADTASGGISDDDGSTADEAPSGGDADDPERGSDDAAEELPKDVQFDILKNSRRRLVIRYLLENDNPVSLGTLSEHVAGVENDKEPRSLDSQERKRAYVGLYQCHLPRMDDAGVIEFNKDRGMVELGPHAEELRPHIDREPESEGDWPKVYLVSSLVGLGLYSVSQSPLLGVGRLGPIVLVATLLVVSAVAGLQLGRRRSED